MDSRDYPEAYLFEEGANITLEGSERYARKLEAENARLREELAAAQQYIYYLTNSETGELPTALAELAAAQLDAARYRWLREECGYVQDGSSTSVAICQDDATYEWIVRLGPIGSKHWWHGRSLGEAIDNAMKEVGHE